MFSFIKNFYKKSEAVAILQSLIEQQQNNDSVFLPAPENVCASNAAKQMVQDAWSLEPGLFSGKFGLRPHKLVFSFYAIVVSILKNSMESEELNDYQLMCLRIATIISNDMTVNAQVYGFSELDYTAVRMSMDIYREAVKRITPEHLDINNIDYELY